MRLLQRPGFWSSCGLLDHSVPRNLRQRSAFGLSLWWMTRCSRDACQCSMFETCFRRFRWSNCLRLGVWTGRAWLRVHSSMRWRWLLLLSRQGTSIYFCDPTRRINANDGSYQQSLSPLPADCVVFPGSVDVCRVADMYGLWIRICYGNNTCLGLCVVFS